MIVLMGTLCCLPCQARDMTGKAGIGALATTSGMQFLTLRYWRTNVATEVLAGWQSLAENAVDAADVTQLRVGLGLGYRIGDQPKASLTAGVRPWMQIEYRTVRVDTTDQTNTYLRYGVEFPLQGEYFVSDNFSVLGTVGVSVAFGAPVGVAQDALAQETRDGSVLVTLGGGFSGGLGMSYYF
ncbi:MAG: hypothetical protein ACOYOB_04530 [Myxococcota bacterium]